MSRIFQNNSQPPTNPNGIRIDSKRRRRLQEKRMAMGHKRDDHEEQVSYIDFEEDGSIDMYFVYSPPRFQED